MDTAELRKLADKAALSSHDDWHPTLEFVQTWVLALRQAADELDRLKAHSESWVQEFIDHACQMERQRDEARSIISLVRSLLSEDGVKDSLAHLSVFHVLLARVDLSPTGLICYHTKAPCESPEACDAQQTCARS